MTPTSMKNPILAKQCMYIPFVVPICQLWCFQMPMFYVKKPETFEKLSPALFNLKEGKKANKPTKKAF